MISRRPGRPKDEQRAERRRDEILACATRWFAEAGYHQTDLERMAAELGCAKGTLYRYFPTKQALFEAAVDRVMRLLLAATRSGGLSEDVGAPATSLRTALAFFDEHPQFVELLIQERAVFRDRAKPTFFEYLESNSQPWRQRFAAMMEAGLVRRMPVDRILNFGANLLYGTIFTNYFARKTERLEHQAAELSDILMHGILTPAGLEQWKQRTEQVMERV